MELTLTLFSKGIENKNQYMWSDNETTQDLLGYQVHADLLKKLVLDDSMLPLTIGVFGNWGSGKSSLMLLLEEEIKSWIESHGSNKNRILQIQFNSWQFDGFESTKMVMIEMILQSITEDIKDHKDIFEKADDFLARIKILEVGIFVAKKLYDKFVPDVVKSFIPSQDELVKITGEDGYKQLISDIQDCNTSKFISQFRELFAKLVEDANYKAVIVYVDDLDRCDPKRIIDILEAIKLFVNVKRTAFVIGADERIIEYAIKLHYPIEQKKEEVSSPFSDYLEKLIQLPYKLPKLSDTEQETYLTLLLCKEKMTPYEFDEIHKDYISFRKYDKHSKYNIDNINKAFPKKNFSSVEYLLPVLPLMKNFLNGNPRQLKRFLNTMSVRLQLAAVAGFSDVRPDVLVKLMLLEYNTLYFRKFEELFKLQRDNKGLLEIKEVESEAKNGNINNELWKEGWSSDYLMKWLASEPSLDNVNLQNYFWVARDALKNQMPIASLVTNKVSLIYKRIKALQSASAVKKDLPDIIHSLDGDEVEMLIMLMNGTLLSSPTSETLWTMLSQPVSDGIFGESVERLKLLFDNVKTEQFEPQSALFLKRVADKGGEWSEFINAISLSDRVKKAMRIKNN